MRDKTGNKLSSQQIITKSMNRLNTILLELDNYILHITSCIPIHHIRRFFCRMAGMKIGRGSTIHTGARYYNPANIVIGNDSIIGENVVLDGRDKINIGDHVDIASEVMIYNMQHDIHSEDFSAVGGPVVIEDYVFIGPRAVILPDVTIKKGAVVAAGAVVTKDVNALEIVGGVPAKVIGERKQKELHYKLGRAAWFR